MGARKKSDEAPEEQNVLLCPSCVQPVDSEAHFCPRCNTPLSTLATIDPIMRLRTYGNFMAKFSDRSRFAGILCILLLVMILLPLLAFVAESILGEEGAALAFRMVVGIPLGIAVISGMVLLFRYMYPGMR